MPFVGEAAPFVVAAAAAAVVDDESCELEELVVIFLVVIVEILPLRSSFSWVWDISVLSSIVFMFTNF